MCFDWQRQSDKRCNIAISLIDRSLSAIASVNNSDLEGLTGSGVSCRLSQRDGKQEVLKSK
jgi:hypothetical protein